uniref:Uncharacterized protein n=1 Tax=Corvus moneduloides TaxID=1196302 RepID=A0A8U7NCX6_CORMO
MCPRVPPCPPRAPPPSPRLPVSPRVPSVSLRVSPVSPCLPRLPVSLRVSPGLPVSPPSPRVPPCPSVSPRVPSALPPSPRVSPTSPCPLVSPRVPPCLSVSLRVAPVSLCLPRLPVSLRVPPCPSPSVSLRVAPVSPCLPRTCGLRPTASDHSSAAGTSRAEGGTSVQPGAWPGIVSIQATWENGTWHMCSGVLLSSQWVLTVAHCFARGGGVSTWEVVIGTTDLTQPGPESKVRHIQRLLVHQHYVAATARNDIALVELDQPVECSDYIQLGCVPDASDMGWPQTGSGCRTSAGPGLGAARAGGKSPPQGSGMVLRESKVHLMDTELCNSSRWYAGAVHLDNLCAGYPQGSIDTCQRGSPRLQGQRSRLLLARGNEQLGQRL